MPFDRCYFKCKVYYIDEYTEVGHSRFILLNKENRNFGRWFNNKEFNEYFTFDNKILRELKLNRIINEESIL